MESDLQTSSCAPNFRRSKLSRLSPFLNKMGNHVSSGLMRLAPPLTIISSYAPSLHIRCSTSIAHISPLNTLSSPSSSSSSSCSSSSDLLCLPSRPSSAYVHLPFCRRRCFYCDFPVVAVGDRNQATKTHYDATMVHYVDAVCREISATARAAPRGGLSTVFFGGGTPSLLPPPLLGSILNCLHEAYGFSSQMEISMEMDPGTFNTASLNDFLALGVNRVSLGVQSFNEKLLKVCGRAHSLGDVYEAINIIQRSHLDNWSLDLIASLPFLTPELWSQSLAEAIEASPAHISVYDLQIEEGTKFGRWYTSGQSPLPCENDSAEFYCAASCKLREAGYDHYELSNYAKLGYRCKHNLVYWHNLPYYAFGLGSTSYVDRKRFSRPRKMKHYLKYVDDLEEAGGEVDFPGDSIEERILDSVMLSLRLSEGLNLREFARLYGRTITLALCRGLQQFVEHGLVLLLDTHGNEIKVHGNESLVSASNSSYIREERDYLESSQANPEAEACKPFEERGLFDEDLLSFLKPGTSFVRLSDPQGFLLSNEIISSLFSEMSISK